MSLNSMIYPLTHSVLYIRHLRLKEPVREQRKYKVRTIKEKTFKKSCFKELIKLSVRCVNNVGIIYLDFCLN